MSDRNERVCTKCGSLLHHEDDCHLIKQQEADPVKLTTDEKERNAYACCFANNEREISNLRSQLTILSNALEKAEGVLNVIRCDYGYLTDNGKNILEALTAIRATKNSKE